MKELVARLALRYIVPLVAAYLAAHLGVEKEAVSQILNDPDFMMILAAAVAGGVTIIEGWYLWAKRKGRTT